MMSRSSDNTSTISLLACSIIPPPLFWNRSIFRHMIIDLTHVCFDVPTQTPLSWAYFLKNKVKSKINKIKKVDRIKWRGTKWRCGNSFFFCAFKFLNFIFLSRQQHIDNSVHQCHRPDQPVFLDFVEVFFVFYFLLCVLCLYTQMKWDISGFISGFDCYRDGQLYRRPAGCTDGREAPTVKKQKNDDGDGATRRNDDRLSQLHRRLFSFSDCPGHHHPLAMHSSGCYRGPIGAG